MMVRYVTHFYGCCGSSYALNVVVVVVVGGGGGGGGGLCLCSTMRCTSICVSMGMQHAYKLPDLPLTCEKKV